MVHTRLDPAQAALGGALIGLGLVAAAAVAAAGDSIAATVVVALAAPVLLAAGALRLLAGMSYRCAACDAPLRAVDLAFPAQPYDTLALLVAEGRTLALARLDAAAPPPAGTFAGLRCEACPACRRVGRVAACRLRADGRGRFEAVEIGAPAEVGAWAIRQLLG